MALTNLYNFNDGRVRDSRGTVLDGPSARDISAVNRIRDGRGSRGDYDRVATRAFTENSMLTDARLGRLNELNEEAKGMGRRAWSVPALPAGSAPRESITYRQDPAGQEALKAAIGVLARNRGNPFGRSYGEGNILMASPGQIAAEADMIPKLTDAVSNINALKGLVPDRNYSRDVLSRVSPEQLLSESASLPGRITAINQGLRLQDEAVARTARERNDAAWQAAIGGLDVGGMPDDPIEKANWIDGQVSAAMDRATKSGADAKSITEFGRAIQAQLDPTGEIGFTRREMLQQSRADAAALREERRAIQREMPRAQAAWQEALSNAEMEFNITGNATQQALGDVGYSGRFWTGGDAKKDLQNPQAVLDVLEKRGDTAGAERFIQSFNARKQMAIESMLALNPEAASAYSVVKDFENRAATLAGLTQQSGGGGAGPTTATGEKQNAPAPKEAAKSDKPMTVADRYFNEVTGAGEKPKGKAKKADKQTTPKAQKKYEGLIGVGELIGDGISSLVDSLPGAAVSVKNRAHWLGMDALQPLTDPLNFAVGGKPLYLEGQAARDAKRQELIQNINALSELSGADRISESAADTNILARLPIGILASIWNAVNGEETRIRKNQEILNALANRKALEATRPTPIGLQNLY